ncbi:MAG: GNAT family N-acetyltransferase [Pseudomonadota bacterium]|nr:GNAT family N-acetyltransferase [Pseudomonadota bacterium]
MALHPPERLAPHHRLDEFVCRHESLTKWLQVRALRNQVQGACNCFVVRDAGGDGNTVVGFYALAAGSLAHASAPGRVRRNMPDPVPVAVLGRLAVHRSFEGQGIGRGMLRDATLRCLRTAREGIGVRAILCHAIDGDAKAFYLHHGFMKSPVDDLTVMLGLADFAGKIEEA